MKYTYKVTPEKVARVKELLAIGHTLREIERTTGLSYATVRNIKIGHYDNDKPIPVKFNFRNRCPITGFFYRNN